MVTVTVILSNSASVHVTFPVIYTKSHFNRMQIDPLNCSELSSSNLKTVSFWGPEATPTPPAYWGPINLLAEGPHTPQSGAVGRTISWTNSVTQIHSCVPPCMFTRIIISYFNFLFLLEAWGGLSLLPCFNLCCLINCIVYCDVRYLYVILMLWYMPYVVWRNKNCQKEGYQNFMLNYFNICTCHYQSTLVFQELTL